MRLGLRPNAGQFALLVVVNALVGGTVGQERTVLPLLAAEVFALGNAAAILTYITAFGVTKALTNLAAGVLADRFGRKPVLLAGWVIGVPVPLLIIAAPSWEWVIAANVVLGINQGLTWSTTVVMKVDLVGPAQRGLAMGFNEAAGYGAVAATALATGWIGAEFGLRPGPFLLGLAYAIVGLAISVVLVRETRGHAEHEQRSRSPATVAWRTVFARTSLGDRNMSAASQAGLINNLNDGMAWGLLPLFYAAAGLSIGEIGVLAAAYPAMWGIGQLVSGALSDWMGRKPLIVAGMFVQAAAIAMIAVVDTFSAWLTAAVILGVGTAMVYPTLIAVIADVAEPAWRGSAIGVYRLWRDLGFAAGAVIAGFIGDRFGMPAAIGVIGVLTALSGAVVFVRMAETRPRRPIPDRIAP